MTTKADFSAEDWTTVSEGPPTAGLLVVMASRGGTFKETVAMAKAYAEARSEHGASELLDEIVSAKPKVDHTRYHSYAELKDHGLGVLRQAMTLLSAKATPQEIDDYRSLVTSAGETSRRGAQGARRSCEPRGKGGAAGPRRCARTPARRIRVPTAGLQVRTYFVAMNRMCSRS